MNKKSSKSDPFICLQAEYDRLLAKYTGAENLIGQVRLPLMLKHLDVYTYVYYLTKGRIPDLSRHFNIIIHYIPV